MYETDYKLKELKDSQTNISSLTTNCTYSKYSNRI